MRYLLHSLLVVIALSASGTAGAADPLPSWNEGATKKAVIDFVAKVTKEGSPDFVPAAERIALFQKHFGEDLAALDADFLRFMRGVQ